MNQSKLTNIFQITSYVKNETNLTIKINTVYHKLLQELFFTKKEKNNNKIYELIFNGIIIILLLFAVTISILILKPYFGDLAGLFGGCIAIIIFIVLMVIFWPFFTSLEKILVTKIEKITLKFSPNGLEIIPDTPKKEPIFIESLNIADIYLKEAEVVESSGNNSYKRRVLNLILLLHKPIPNKLTNKDIEEIFLLEKINREKLEELKKIAEDMKKALKT